MQNTQTSDSGIFAHLVKLGEQGLLTLALPEMIGRYVMIELHEGQVTIRAMDLDTAEMHPGIVRHAGRMTLVAAPLSGSLPQA